MTSIDKKKIKQAAKEYGIKSLAVFGSRALGNFRPSSDLDLLVTFFSPKSLLELVRIERELSGALKIKVDLLTRNSLSPYFRKDVLKEAIKIL